MAKKKESKPLLAITPENLIARKYRYILGTSNSMCKVYCHLIDSVAADKGWDLDELEWTHEDGTLFKGLNPVKSRLEVYREPLELGLEVQYVVEDAAKSQVLVVLKGSLGKYRCMRYVEVENELTHSYDRQGVDIDEVFKWIADPKPKG
jgi:hypothetical protein